MEKKNVLTLGLLFLALLVIGGGLYYLYTEEENEIAENQNREELEELPLVEIEPMPYDDFALTYEYKGENTWDYEVTGKLPNPCYIVTTEPVVMESDPEQVSIKTKIQEPSPDEICTQVIQEVEETGTFSASEDAEIILDIELIPANTSPTE